MKKIFSKILIAMVLVGIFMMPIGGGIKVVNDKLAVRTEISKVEAQGIRYYYEQSSPLGNSILGYDTKEACDKAQANTESLSGLGYGVVQPCTGSATKLDKLGDYDFACHPLGTLGNVAVTVATAGIVSGGAQSAWDGIEGCIAAFTYMIWDLGAWIVEFAGRFLDFFVYYSITSDSYTSNGFVDNAWGVVRDIANVFFIIALLYVAIKTILGIGVSDSKKMVGWIVVIALLINFSLFTTKVVVDASNILAKIFYHNITPQGVGGAQASGKEGEKSISIGLIRSYNPQKIIKHDYYLTNKGTFIFVALMAIAITLYTAYVFFAVALLFVARVVGLWIAMIFSPLAFASYTVSFDMGGLGHKKWWPNLFQLAFMAPLFIFFLYIIVLFLQIGQGLVYHGDQSDIMQNLMSVVIPFAIIYILLMKAKNLAVEYSGELGEGIMKVGKTVGGVAIGAATGGAAFLGTKYLGGYASKALSDNGEALRAKANEGGLGGAVARMKLKALNYGTKATYDARQTKLGGEIGKMSGMNFQSAKMIGLGSKEGGISGAAERRSTKLNKEKETYKTTMTDAEVKTWSDQNMLKYYADRSNAIGNKTGEAKEKAIADFESKNKKPTEYSTADELDKSRMIAFRDRQLGKKGLLHKGVTAYLNGTGNLIDKDNFSKSNTYAKEYEAKLYNEAKTKSIKELKEDFNLSRFNAEYNSTPVEQLKYDEGVAKKINDEAIRKTKVVVGASVGGALGGIALGTPGVALGMAAGGIPRSTVAEMGAKKFASGLTKEIDKLGAVETRLNEAKTLLATQENMREAGKAIVFEVRDAAGNVEKNDDGTVKKENVFVKDADGKDTNKVDKDKLAKAIAEKEVDMDGIRVQLAKINKNIVKQGLTPDPQLLSEKNRLTAIQVSNTVDISKLKVLTNIEETIANTNNRILDLTGRKGDMKDKNKPADGGHKPSVSSTSSHSAPAVKKSAPAADHSSTTTKSDHH